MQFSFCLNRRKNLKRKLVGVNEFAYATKYFNKIILKLYSEHQFHPKCLTNVSKSILTEHFNWLMRLFAIKQMVGKHLLLSYLGIC